MAKAKGKLAEIGYIPPKTPQDVILDVVTPTADRLMDLTEQAMRLAEQLAPNDRWIVVDDASSGGACSPSELASLLPDRNQLMMLIVSYCKGGRPGTVNMARHFGCSAARPGAWIVELDDHDHIMPRALDLIREGICAGAAFLYGDTQWFGEGDSPGQLFHKPDYIPYLLRDGFCPCEGVRAFPAWLYRAVSGYRWHGPLGVHGNEFPAGDYALYARMEQFCEGQGFARIPFILNKQPKIKNSISGQFGAEQKMMADLIRKHAQEGTLL